MKNDMDSISSLWTVIFCGIIFILSIIWHFTNKRRKNTPPDVKGHFIRGYEPALKPRTFTGFMKLKKDHPDIVTVHIGFSKYIFLMSHRAIVESLLNKADNFSGRPNDIQKILARNSGIIFMDSTLWKNHRRFALRVLRDFGFGRNLSEEIVHSEVQTLLTYIDQYCLSEKEGINTSGPLQRSIANVICTLTMGEQPGFEDDVFGEVVRRVKVNLGTSEYKLPFNLFPFLIHLFPLMQKFSKQTQILLDNVTFVENYIDLKIQKHVKEFNPEQEPCDYIDAFLVELHKESQNTLVKGTNVDHSFTLTQLRREIIEFFVAGTDTTANSLSWSLLMLALHPEIQKKCHEEIDAKIEGRIPSMKDKQSTPYILAVLDEVQRFTTLVPMSLIHRCFEEVEVLGYTIPANSLVVPFIYGVHHDDKVWEKPFEFYPQHFLTEDGLHYQPRQEMIAFSLGRRSCLGESLARVEFYMFFVSLVQRYQVVLNEKDKEHLEEIMLGSDGIVHAPGDHRIIFQLRNCGDK